MRQITLFGLGTVELINIIFILKNDVPDRENSFNVLSSLYIISVSTAHFCVEHSIRKNETNASTGRLSNENKKVWMVWNNLIHYLTVPMYIIYFSRIIEPKLTTNQTINSVSISKRFPIWLYTVKKLRFFASNESAITLFGFTVVFFFFNSNKWNL